MSTTHDDTGAMGTVATTALAGIAVVLSAGALIVAAATDATSGGGTDPASVATDATPAAVEAVEDGAALPEDLSISLTEFAIAPDAVDVGTGTVVTVSNDGAAPHDLVIDDLGLGTPELSSGGTATLDFTGVEPGSYEWRCTVPGHDTAGMTGTVTVHGDGAVLAADAVATDHSGHGATDEMDWAAMDQAMVDTINAFPAATEGVGNQLLEPEEVLEDGTKVFRLVAEIFDWEIEPGVIVEGWGYNGQIPGPEIHVDVGDRVRVHVENELPMGTDVHWHGIIVPNDQDGVAPLTQPLIQPGETYTYEFTTREPAIGMYHPHHHGQMKLPNGMFGAFRIGDVGDDIPLPSGTIGGRIVPEDLEIAQEIPMVLNDAGNIGYAINGKSFPATAPVNVEEGDWIVVHYYNEGLQIHPMHLHQMPQLVFAKDGFPLDAPQWEDTVNVAPGERYSVLIPATDPGVWMWHCHILTHAERNEGMFGMVTALIVD